MKHANLIETKRSQSSRMELCIRRRWEWKEAAEVKAEVGRAGACVSNPSKKAKTFHLQRTTCVERRKKKVKNENPIDTHSIRRYEATFTRSRWLEFCFCSFVVFIINCMKEKLFRWIFFAFFSPFLPFLHFVLFHFISLHSLWPLLHFSHFSAFFHISSLAEFRVCVCGGVMRVIRYCIHISFLFRLRFLCSTLCLRIGYGTRGVSPKWCVFMACK